MSDQDKTVRISAEGEASEGSGADSGATQRIDSGAQSEATVRIEDAAAVRIEKQSPQASGPSGSPEATVRLDQRPGEAGASDVRKAADVSALAVAQSQGEVFAPGQSVELGGRPCTVKSVISTSSGEAVIYEVDREGASLVLKLYRKGFRLPSEVIGRIKGHAGEHIVRVHDFGERGGQDWELMEYARGGTLDQLLRARGPIRDTALLKSLIRQVAEGLHELHETVRIIYQDLKPENIYFRDEEKTAVVLADFGISSVMEKGKSEAIVRANGTKEYAALELTRFGNQTDALVDTGVDYFALGITMLHLWLGAKPFQGIPDAVRLQQIRDKAVQFPEGIDGDVKTLIQGLINPLPKERWGYAEVKKWLAGEPLSVNYEATLKPYAKRSFSSAETFETPAELAALLAKYPDRGADYLYLGKIKEWLDEANDMELSTEMEKIVRRYADQKKAGIFRAVYTLDPERPFVTQGGASCSDPESMGEALWKESAHYKEALKNPFCPVYIYFETVGGANGEAIAESFRDIFKTEAYGPERAMSSLVLRLMSNGEGKIKLGDRYIYDPEELREADPALQGIVKGEIAAKDSRLLVWLTERNVIGDSESYAFANAVDLFILLKLMPFLNYKELVKKWETECMDDLCVLVSNRRFDLIDFYLSLGLPLNGNSTAELLDWAPTPLNCAVVDNDLEMVQFLLDKGSDPDLRCGDGTTALLNAVRRSNRGIVESLLARGADPNLSDKLSGERNPLQIALSSPGEDEKGRQKNYGDADIAIAKSLLERGASARVADSDGWTPLHLAVLFGVGEENLKLLELLIAKGADINAKKNDGYTPLMNAIICCKDEADRESRRKVVEFLLEHGAKTEVLNGEGHWSPLMSAAGEGLPDIAEMLVKHGAKKTFADAQGEIAFCYAKSYKHEDCAAIVDPKGGFALTRGLFAFGRVLLKIAALVALFFTMDLAARIVNSFALSPLPLGIATYLLSQFFSAYILVALCGSFYRYWVKLRGSFSHLGGVLLYLIGLPLLFPLAVSLLYWGLGFIPEPALSTIYRIGGWPVNLVAGFETLPALILGYTGLLAVFLAPVIVISVFAEKLEKKYRMYKRYV